MKKGKFTKPKMKIDKVYYIADGEREYSIATDEMWKNDEVFPILVAKDEADDYTMEFSDSDSLIIYYKFKDALGKTKEVFAFEWVQGY